MQTQSPSTAAHEERLAQYARQLEVFDGSTDRFDAGFICIDPSHLTANARCEAATWLVRSCGAMVGDADRAAMQVGECANLSQIANCGLFVLGFTSGEGTTSPDHVESLSRTP